MGNCCPRILGRGSTTEEDKDLDQALLSSPEGKKVTAEHFKILKVIYVILFSSISILPAPRRRFIWKSLSRRKKGYQ